MRRITGPGRLATAELPEIAGFVIEEELGRGSMGVVYRAWQPRLARRVALKVIAGGPVDGASREGPLAPRGSPGRPRARSAGRANPRRR